MQLNSQQRYHHHVNIIRNAIFSITLSTKMFTHRNGKITTEKIVQQQTMTANWNNIYDERNVFLTNNEFSQE